jgi:hypothetical protein
MCISVFMLVYMCVNMYICGMHYENLCMFVMRVDVCELYVHVSVYAFELQMCA